MNSVAARALRAALRRLGVTAGADAAMPVDRPAPMSETELLPRLAERLEAALGRLRETVPRMADDALHDLGDRVVAGDELTREPVARLADSATG